MKKTILKFNQAKCFEIETIQRKDELTFFQSSKQLKQKAFYKQTLTSLSLKSLGICPKDRKVVTKHGELTFSSCYTNFLFSLQITQSKK